MDTQTLTPVCCIARIDNCDLCAREPLRNGSGHFCDDLCMMRVELRKTDSGHAATHEPLRHDCGAILDDRLGNRYEIQRFCGWGTCVQFYCPGCRRFSGGWGPVGCQCEDRPCGHGTFHEYPRPGAGRFRKPSIFSRRRR